jgi:hypothetical protein
MSVRMWGMVHDWQDGLSRATHRPLWRKGTQGRLSRTRSPVFPHSDRDPTPLSPKLPWFASSPPVESVPAPSLPAGYEAFMGDAELPTVEAINVHPEDAYLPVTETNVNGNVTVGYMQDLTLLDSLVTSTTTKTTVWD